MSLVPGLQAAIVDLDGTLVDTLGDFTIALNTTLAELSLPPLDAPRIALMVGKGSEHLIRSALAAAGGAPAQYDAAWGAYQRHYDAVNGRHSDVYAGAEEGLRVLRREGLRLACVTNKPYSFTEPLLAKTGLAQYFELVYGGDAFPLRKPDPFPLLKVADAFGLEPSAMAALGDSISSGFNSCGWYVSCASRSWSAGDHAAVDSHYTRLLRLGPGLKGHNRNFAVPGSTSTDLMGQVRQAIEAKADYVTVLIGAQDACKRTEREMTSVSVYRSRIDAALAALAPAASAMLASRWPRGAPAPMVLSLAVWCSTSALSSAPTMTSVTLSHIQVRKPMSAPREPYVLS